jgi:hypothetical protein
MEDNSPAFNNLPRLLETAAKALVFCYGLGYLINIIYDSTYGIYDVNIIKARPLFSGVTFLVLAAVVFFVIDVQRNWIFVSGRWSLLRAEIGKAADITFRWRILFGTVWFLTMLIELDYLSTYLLLFTSLPIDRISLQDFEAHTHAALVSDQHVPRFLTFLAVKTICGMSLPILWAFLIPKHWRWAAFGTTTACVIYFASDIIAGTGNRFVIWIVAMLLLTFTTRNLIQGKKESGTLLSTLVTLVLSVVLYARLVYPNILPWYGGPTRATVSITTDSNKGLGQLMRLIEETDAGYYLVPLDSKTHDAIFIPRAEVKSVKFYADPYMLSQ